MSSSKGFTLIELMITIAVAAILLTVALPSFQDSIRRNRILTQASDIVSTLALARSEAVKRNQTVSVVVADAANSNGTWAGGWCITEGAPADCTGAVIRIYPAIENNSLSSATTSFSFDKKGFLSTAAGTVSVCKSSGEAGRNVVINGIGQAVVQEITCS